MSERARAMRMLLMLAIAAGTGTAQQSGQALYQSNCAGCHGLDGRGGEHAPNIATVERVQQLTDTDLLRIVRNGLPSAGMPAFGSRLSPQQLSALLSYVRTLQGERKTAALPGDPGAGHTLFFNSAGCSECHMIAGKGGFIGGDLSSYASAHSIEQIRDAIEDPNDNLDPRHSVTTVVTKAGQRYTGIVRNEDNSSLQLQGRDGAFHLLEKSTLARITHEKRSWMPADYSSKLSPAEINDLISYLMQIAAAQPRQAEDTSEW